MEAVHVENGAVAVYTGRIGSLVQVILDSHWPRHLIFSSCQVQVFHEKILFLGNCCTKQRCLHTDGGGEETAGNNMDGSTSYPKLSHHIKQHYSTRYGVETWEVVIVVHALPMSSRKYVMGAGKGRITLEKQWHNNSQPYCPPGHC